MEILRFGQECPGMFSGTWTVEVVYTGGVKLFCPEYQMGGTLFRSIEMYNIVNRKKKREKGGGKDREF
jgi:hypothetical protein